MVTVLSLDQYAITLSLSPATKNQQMIISRMYAPCRQAFSSFHKYYTNNDKSLKRFSLFHSIESQHFFCRSTLVDSTIETSTQLNPNTPSSIHVTKNIIQPLEKELNQRIESNDKQLHNDHFETLFSLELPEGRCVGLRLPTEYQAPGVSTSLCPSQIKSNHDHWIKNILHPKEIEFSLELPSDTARMTFVIGRLAMRSALMLSNSCSIDNLKRGQKCNEVDIGCDDKKFSGFVKLPLVSKSEHSILKDHHGRPQVPKGFIGSISHKKTTGVALVNNLPEDHSVSSTPKIGIGVDIEQTFSRRRSIATKILTRNELESLGHVKGVTRDEEVLLRFSLKECVYKAMHPLISQFVGFQEAEIQPHDDGTATVKLNLKSGAHEQFKSIKAHWRRIDGDFFLTSSSVTMKD